MVKLWTRSNGETSLDGSRHYVQIRSSLLRDMTHRGGFSVVIKEGIAPNATNRKAKARVWGSTCSYSPLMSVAWINSREPKIYIDLSLPWRSQSLELLLFHLLHQTSVFFKLISYFLTLLSPTKKKKRLSCANGGPNGLGKSQILWEDFLPGSGGYTAVCAIMMFSPRRSLTSHLLHSETFWDYENWRFWNYEMSNWLVTNGIKAHASHISSC